MKKTGIFYGSSTGTTEKVAGIIAEKLGISPNDVHNIESNGGDLSKYDFLIFGASSTGIGDLQDFWENFLNNTLKSADLNGKTVALFCCGDSYTYSDSFCGAMRKIYDAIKDRGCTITGNVSTDGYETDDSDAVIDDKFVGLAIDNDNEEDKTPERINAWIKLIKK
ncbi:MAG: flavodoxin [Prevotellaceae bacterium]|jgi:flavodoxin I|nr:flavodoxin [Prevotellaceae bacterium]